MVPKEYVIYQDRLYWVFKRVPHSKIKEGYTNDVKEFWNCDVVVKSRQNNDDNLLFLREIPEAQIVKDLI